MRLDRKYLPLLKAAGIIPAETVEMDFTDLWILLPTYVVVREHGYWLRLVKRHNITTVEYENRVPTLGTRSPFTKFEVVNCSIEDGLAEVLLELKRLGLIDEK
jgi:hypothetical protein